MLFLSQFQFYFISQKKQGKQASTMNVLKWPLHLFNAFEKFWNKRMTQKVICLLLAIVFLLSLAIIELNRRGFLPEGLNTLVPLNHFQAVTLTFYLLLVVEIIALILLMGASVTLSVGKELEILALIMLRNAFKTLGQMQEPIDPSLDIIALTGIMANCIAAILIFICSRHYVRLQEYECPVPEAEQRAPIYNAAKKCTALVLLSLFLFDGFSHIGALMTGNESLAAQANFFARFYTLLIFADIFLLLASESAAHSPILLFRNSGYTAGALFMRMALGAPHFWDAGLGVFAAIYILAVSYAVKRLRMQSPAKQKRLHLNEDHSCKGIAKPKK